jgi:hypothetical protein
MVGKVLEFKLILELTKKIQKAATLYEEYSLLSITWWTTIIRYNMLELET